MKYLVVVDIRGGKTATCFDSAEERNTFLIQNLRDLEQVAYRLVELSDEEYEAMKSAGLITDSREINKERMLRLVVNNDKPKPVREFVIAVRVKSDFSWLRPEYTPEIALKQCILDMFSEDIQECEVQVEEVTGD